MHLKDRQLAGEAGLLLCGQLQLLRQLLASCRLGHSTFLQLLAQLRLGRVPILEPLFGDRQLVMLRALRL